MTQAMERTAREAAAAPLAPVPPRSLPASNNGESADGSGTMGDVPIAAPAAATSEVPPSELAARLQRGEPRELLHLLERTAPPVPGPTSEPLLPRILAGVCRLEAASLRPVELTFFDPELDSYQRQAVARALVTPDLLMLQGLPGTGKTRALTELIQQLTLRNQRVAFVARSRRALDAMLAGMPARPFLFPLRLLLRDERAESLPRSVQDLTPARAASCLSEKVARAAERGVASAELDHRRAAEDVRVLGLLHAAASEWQACAARRDELQLRRSAIHGQVCAEADTPPVGAAESDFHKPIHGERTRHEDAFRALDRQNQEAAVQLEQTRADHLQRLQQVERQRHLLEARGSGRWYSLAWWRVLLQGRRAEERLRELQRLEAEAQKARSDAEDRARQLQAQIAQERDYHARALAHLLDAETGRRQASLDQELAQAAAAADRLASECRRLRDSLSNPLRLPDTPGLEAVVACAQSRQLDASRCQEQLEQRRREQSAIAALLPSLFEKLPRLANLIAGTPDALQRFSNPGKFDVLVIDDADELPAQDLISLATCADRVVMAGRPPCSPPCPCPPTAPRAFDRTWQNLRRDPLHLPHEWEQQSETLVCRLHTIPGDALSQVEVERLVDQPDVQLRILARPGGKPILAEVAFPLARFDIRQAKSFLYQNLQELPLHLAASSLRWREQGDWLLADFAADSSAGQEIEVPLEEGVCEIVQPAAVNGRSPLVARWITARLRFDRRRGWDRERAEQWLRDRTGLADSGRNCVLPRSWRSAPALAQFWHERLYAGAQVNLHPIPGRPGGAVRFLCNSARPAAAGSSGSSRGKAPVRPHGLELDLSNARQRQELPAELRAALPTQGFVNLGEAREVIARVKPTLQQHNSEAREGEESVAVVSWQSSQVELLRLLWRQVGAQVGGAAPTPAVAFCTIADLRDREPQVVLASLCRSHAQRPLAYAERVDEWLALLTSAREQLVLLGDPHSLEQRSRCDRPLGKQDAATAALEQYLTASLLPLAHKQKKR